MHFYDEFFLVLLTKIALLIYSPFMDIYKIYADK